MKILLGKANGKDILLDSAQLNRHGLIAGASGTGKTVSLKVIAEGLSDIGVPTVIADVKGDLSGMIAPGDFNKISDRVQEMGLTDFDCKSYPVTFFDVFKEKGHPIRVVLQEMGPLLLSRILDLSEAQEGVLAIVFQIAQDMELEIIDLKDLQAMLEYVGQHASEITLKYGNVTRQSVGTIQRKLLTLTQQNVSFFSQPSLDIFDWMKTRDGKGVMNILECQTLFRYPQLYATFLFWMLDELFQQLPEVGDSEKPKMVFFFDEAHLLFKDAPKALLQQIEQTVKLIRSKGVGIFFITQSPTDIPNEVLAQLSNRIQHALRAYTPSEIKTVKLAADSFRANPNFDTAEAICNMKTGVALVSVLDSEGAPTVVEQTMICPPKSSMQMADDYAIRSVVEQSELYGKYEREYDPESAFEQLDDIQKAEIEQKQQEKLRLQEEKLRMREEERQKRYRDQWATRLQRKATNRLESEMISFGLRSAKKLLKGFLK